MRCGCCNSKNECDCTSNENSYMEMQDLRNQVEELKLGFSEAVDHAKKLKVEVYCLYKQATNTRLDKSKDFDCIVKRKVLSCEEFLEKHSKLIKEVEK